MEISLQELTAEEVQKYIELQSPIYAENVSSNQGIPKEVALRDAEKTYKLLSEENRKNGQYIGHVFCEEKKQNVGIIWYNIQAERDRVFIYHIYIEEAFRKQGYAHAALTLVEEVARRESVGRMALNVFAANEGAQRLYERLGYETASIVKTKKL
ncbi:GNAT family N-acetyltransferase [Terribacillus halophilus]|jgi:ribosomal protein S18 acetylase RimI-like enzyme|uniref:GNAT family N-acetyltransferase n=1 Tax=Terribacillus halophilus TaxID=361279 RepID=UPI00098469D7|nr:GNAT family N-acetyltransferase [Terribacillus halophilus]